PVFRRAVRTRRHTAHVPRARCDLQEAPRNRRRGPGSWLPQVSLQAGNCARGSVVSVSRWLQRILPHPDTLAREPHPTAFAPESAASSLLCTAKEAGSCLGSEWQGERRCEMTTRGVWP